MPELNEKMAALERVIGSRLFRRRARQADLLNRLVKDTLTGDVGGEGYEQKLAKEVFKKGATWMPMDGTAVRAQMSNLRRSLREYYRTQGSADTVEIRFPKGYEAHFSYRPQATTEESADSLCSEFWAAFPDLVSCKAIIEKLRNYTRQYSADPSGFAVLAEALLACAIIDETANFLADEARQALKTGMELSNELWRLHVVAAALHMRDFQWAKADSAFRTALSLAPEAAGTHFWFSAFLLATGRTDEALERVSRPLVPPWGRPETRLRVCARPLFLYVTGRHQEAYHELSSFQELPSADVYEHLKKVRAVELRLQGRGPLDTWLGELLMACVCHALGHVTLAAELAEAASLHSRTAAFAGLVILLTANAKNKRPRKPAGARAWQKPYGHVASGRSTLSDMLVSLSEGNIDHAASIFTLDMAFNTYHPVMAWAHLWPVLEPLRDSEDFKRFITSMNLDGENDELTRIVSEHAAFLRKLFQNKPR